jgi:DNA-binding response OmpR family regulator
VTAPHPRVLVVEDEFLIALSLEAALHAGGYEVAGPCRSVSDGLRELANEAPAAAVLDVNLGGEKAFPIADALAARGVPVVFVTGYEREDLPERFRAARMLVKPCAPDRLLSAVAASLRSG